MSATAKAAVQIRSISKGPISFIRLYGVIDETFDTKELMNAATGRDIIMNLKAVTRLSSFGVREWVHAMEALAKKVDRVTVVECSPAFVAQLNMVGNFANHTRVVSVQVPYFCEACSWDTEVTQQLDHDLRNPETPLAAVPCKRCGAAMQMDDERESYFAFQKDEKTTAV